MCAGLGQAATPPPSYQGDEPWPVWLAATAELLAARNRIERYGLDGWLSLDGLSAEDLDPLLPEALSYLDAELGRLEQEERVKDAGAARRRSK